MCGIVGYIGHREVVSVLIEALRRLEYRGYDSAGVALLADGKLDVVKVKGKIDDLEAMLSTQTDIATAGIGHTRWATHGEPSELNAHPHTDCTGKIAVVHNGIIEDYRALREYLTQRGHIFTTETDTEILAHLIEDFLKEGNDLKRAVRLALLQIEGTYGIAVLYTDEPEHIIAARHGSPLLIGVGQNENFIASDPAAVLRYTDRVIYLDEEEMAEITADSYEILTLHLKRVEPRVEKLAWDIQQLEKSGFEHFMLKEIYEQPQTLRNAYRGRLNIDDGVARLNGLKRYLQHLEGISRVIVSSCGTSYHSALIGEYLIEELAGIPVEVDYASEFRYRSPIVNEGTAVIVISQSGETADTLAALREAKRKKANVFGIVNVVGSSIARETDAGVYCHAGPEIGVASTKAFTSQVMVLSLISLLLGRMRELSAARGRELIGDLAMIPDEVEEYLERERREQNLKQIAQKYKNARNFLYMGRGVNYPVAMEGALKLKEISYIHAEGYPAGEMKHGPIALIDKDMPVVVIATSNLVYPKIVSNIEEIRSRGGRIIAIATEGDGQIADIAEDVIYVPKTANLFSPMVNVIPLQLLAYHIAVLRGCNVDQPRNLAKSVTVE